MSASTRWLAACLLAGTAVAAHADSEFSGQLRGRWDDRTASLIGPLAQAAQLDPTVAPPQASAATLEAELRGRWQMLSAVATLRSEKPESAAWHSDGVMNELYASGEAAGWQLSAGRKIVAWDVGYAFRPNDIIQQERRRTLLSFTPEGRALLMGEHFDARTAWSLVWVNPQRAVDDDAGSAMGAEEQALALRVFRNVGEADWHGFARWGQHTRASLGAAVSWVADDSLELHASGRWAERADVLTFNTPASGLATSSPFTVATRNNCAQALVGGTWTAENRLSLMAEFWYDGTAASNAQWDDWQARNAQITAAWVNGGPAALRRGVAGNLAWQSQAFAGQSLRRSNVYLRASWDHEGWQPSLDVLYMPADGGRMVTAALGWQGDRVRVDAGLRVNGGPDDSVAAQLPVRRQAYAAL
ncbi:MAG TPA: hypothetical protein VFL64_19785, partial [Rhizobacter sp.]|nr:hypothetical protein [Rhizobacter sp.]